MKPDLEVARRARGQHGLVARRQALSIGLSRKAISHRVRSGRWETVRAGVFAVGGYVPSWQRSVLAAVLAAGETAAASHLTAAHLWGVHLECPNEIEITTAIERQIRLVGIAAHRTGILPEHDRATHLGIPVATMARTVVDLSGSIATPRLGSLLDEGLRRRLLTLTALHACASRLSIPAPGRRPVIVQSLLAARIPGYDPGDSDLETRCWQAIRAAGLPLPVPQFRVSIGDHRYRIDLAYPDARLAIEVDGFDFHRSRTSFDADRARGNALVLAGWQLLRFTSKSSDEEMVACITAAREASEAFVRSGPL